MTNTNRIVFVFRIRYVLCINIQWCQVIDAETTLCWNLVYPTEQVFVLEKMSTFSGCYSPVSVRIPTTTQYINRFPYDDVCHMTSVWPRSPCNRLLPAVVVMLDWRRIRHVCKIQGDYTFTLKQIASTYTRTFRGRLPDSGMRSKFGLRPVFVKWASH